MLQATSAPESGTPELLLLLNLYRTKFIADRSGAA